MLGNQRGFEACNGVSHARKMLAIDAIDGAEAKTDAMQTQRIVGPGAFEGANRGAAFVEVIFGVRFDPAYSRTLVEQVLVMDRPKTDSGTRRNRSRPHTS